MIAAEHEIRRLFFALWPDEAIRSQIASAAFVAKDDTAGKFAYDVDISR